MKTLTELQAKTDIDFYEFETNSDFTQHSLTVCHESFGNGNAADPYVNVFITVLTDLSSGKVMFVANVGNNRDNTAGIYEFTSFATRERCVGFLRECEKEGTSAVLESAYNLDVLLCDSYENRIIDYTVYFLFDNHAESMIFLIDLLSPKNNAQVPA